MAKVKWEKYLSVDDYKSGQKVPKDIDIDITIDELKLYAVTLGNLGTHVLSSKGCDFFESFVDMSLNESKGKIDVTDDFKKSETSLQSAFSFLMGMILAKAVADKKYKISYLFHLNDPTIVYKCIKGKSHPDFWGKSTFGTQKSYLFEAKGRKENRIAKNSKGGEPEIDRVKRQLTNVNVWDGCNLIQNQCHEKHILLTLMSPEFLVIDIDPPSEEISNEKIDLKLNFKKLLKDYYANIRGVIKEQRIDILPNDKELIETVSKQVDAVFCKIGDSYVGLPNRIENKLQEFENEMESNDFNWNDPTEEYLDKQIRENNEENKKIHDALSHIGEFVVSCRRDGLIILKRE